MELTNNEIINSDNFFISHKRNTLKEVSTIIKKYVDGLYHQRVAAKANRETENIYFSLQDIKHDIIRDLKLQYKKVNFHTRKKLL